MTRCVACDKNLNDFESTRKVIREDGTTEYPDLCNTCFKESGIASHSNIVERYDLSHSDDIDDDYDNSYHQDEDKDSWNRL